MKQKKDINVQIGKNIQKERERVGLTQERMSELLEIGPKSLSAIERGAVGVSLSLLCRICNLLSISSDALIFGRSADPISSDFSERLAHLPPEQRKIAEDILHKLLEAFSINK